MELDRTNIEKRDFPAARRGYDPEAVDRHLREIAAAVEAQKSAQPQQHSLAGTAAARVEAIVAAAEASAAEIEARARAEAEEARQRARTLSEEAQAKAHQDAADQVRRAEEVVDRLFARAQELQQQMNEMSAAIGAVKSAVDEMRSDVASLELRPASEDAAPSALEFDDAPLAEPEPAQELDLGMLELPADPEPEPVTAEPAPEPTRAPAAPAPEPGAATPAEPASRSGGGVRGNPSEGARLIALNMALSGAPREETARYLRENFDLDDQDELLDDVYARAGS